MSRKSKRVDSIQASQMESATKMSVHDVEQQSFRNHNYLAVNMNTLERRIEALRCDLPHLYGLKFYKWQREFFESRNKMNLLCAANQIGKSTIAIRKNIEWACNKKLWKDLWNTTPRMFWYFYPSGDVATIEFEKKWVPDYLPRGAMKADPQYGWEADYVEGDISAVHFRSGVSIFFKTYGQRIINLQTATVHMVTCDEEMPESYVDELIARLRATGGYYNQVFTATVGYQLWYQAMECIGTDDEAFKLAHKQVVSMYDCVTFEDGTASMWTLEKIAEAEASCSSKKEVARRIHGRFVRDEGLRYESFDYDRNAKPFEPLPKDWSIYVGIDIGSGGKNRSSGSIVFIAVSPDFSKARVIDTWRGDNVETTASDILAIYRKMRGERIVVRAAYDYASREFGLISSRMSENFERADKSKVSGESTLNTLFKAGALVIDTGGDGHYQKLITELMSIPGGAEKNRKFKDDLADALKYAIALIPWDFAKIQSEASGQPVDVKVDDNTPKAEWTEAEYEAWQIRQRRGEMEDIKNEGWYDYEMEVSEWNQAYGN